MINKYTFILIITISSLALFVFQSNKDEGLLSNNGHPADDVKESNDSLLVELDEYKKKVAELEALLVAQIASAIVTEDSIPELTSKPKEPEEKRQTIEDKVNEDFMANTTFDMDIELEDLFSDVSDLVFTSQCTTGYCRFEFFANIADVNKAADLMFARPPWKKFQYSMEGSNSGAILNIAIEEH